MALTNFPTVLINNVTGQDAGTSGAGPLVPISGANAYLNGTTTVTLSIDSPDLSSVATDGSALIYVDSSAGRKYGRINTVDNGSKTVTCEFPYTVSESGRSWGIGGKRGNLSNANTALLFASSNVFGGYTILIENSGLPYNVTSTVTVTSYGHEVSGVYTILGSGNPLITTSTNSVHIFTLTGANAVIFDGLQFANGAATKGRTFTSAVAASSPVMLKNLRIGLPNSGFATAVFANSSIGIYAHNCDFGYCTSDAIQQPNPAVFTSCYFHDNSGSANQLFNSQTFVFNRCIFHENLQGALIFTGLTSSPSLFMFNNQFTNNKYGVFLPSGQSNNLFSIFQNNVFYNNREYDFWLQNPLSANYRQSYRIMSNNNAYGGSASGVLGIPSGDFAISLSSSPFVDLTARNFTLTDSSPLRNAGFPGSFSYLTSRGYLDVGALQSSGVSSQGGVTVSGIFTGSFYNRGYN